MKTIEEQARSFACITANEYACVDEDVRIDIKDDLQYAFVSGAEAATRWIPVEEENPYSTKPVILYGTDRHGKAGYCVDYYYGPKFKLGDSYLYVSHWLPIPPMPGK